MIGRLADWYPALTARERVLVAVLGVIVAGLVLVYGIILPVGAAHDSAHDRQRAASEQAGRIKAGLALIERAPKAILTGGSQSLDLEIATSAETQGFTLQSNQPRGNDATSVVISSALPGPVLVWLNGLEASGIQLESLTITPAADGRVAVNAGFRRNGR